MFSLSDNALIIILAMTGYTRSVNPDSSSVNGYPKMHTLPFEQIRPNGEWGSRYQAATVNLQMFELTGETRFVDDAELTLVNHFFMNQFNTGGFGHLAFSQEIIGGKAGRTVFV